MNPVTSAFRQSWTTMGIVTAVFFAFLQLVRLRSPFFPLKSPITLVTGAERSTILGKALIMFIGIMITNFFGNLWVLSRAPTKVL